MKGCVHGQLRVVPETGRFDMTTTQEELPGADNSAQAALLTVDEVARMLNCSVRTVYRLVDQGRIPRPLKLGALSRWSRDVIEQWICEGCPKTQKRNG